MRNTTNKTIFVIAFSLMSVAANATTWDFEGVVDNCNDFVCNLVGIGVGEPIAGFFTAFDAAAGPNSTFSEDDISNYGISAQGVTAGPADSALVSAKVTTDENGRLAAGTMIIAGQVDAGSIFGLVDFDATIDVGTGDWMVATDLLGLGVVASGTGQWLLEPDDDDVASVLDNCIDIGNPMQIDADLDGHGNVCDADFNNDCQINFADLALMGDGFFRADPILDMDSDGTVNFVDLNLLADLFFLAPGPSAAGSLCNP